MLPDGACLTLHLILICVQGWLFAAVLQSAGLIWHLNRLVECSNVRCTVRIVETVSSASKQMLLKCCSS
jgi:hypothetical protein